MSEILEGVAHVDLCAGEIEIGGKKHAVSLEPCTFMLETDEDQLVQVRVTLATAIGPIRKLHEAPWAELEDHPLVETFDDPPGGHVQTELRGASISDGDRIWVAGAIDRTTGTDGYRGGSDPFVRAIEALWIGVGDEGREWVEKEAAKAAPEPEAPEPAHEPPSAPSQPSLMGAQVLSVLTISGIFASVILWTREPLARAILAFSLLMMSLALFIWQRRRFLPRMFPAFGTATPRPGAVGGPRVEFRLLWGIGEAGVPVTVFAGLLMLAPALMAATADDVGSVFLFVILLITVLIQLGFTWWWTRKHARLLGVVAKSKPASGDGWGLREGEVVRAGSTAGAHTPVTSPRRPRAIPTARDGIRPARSRVAGTSVSSTAEEARCAFVSPTAERSTSKPKARHCGEPRDERSRSYGSTSRSSPVIASCWSPASKTGAPSSEAKNRSCSSPTPKMRSAR